MQWGERANNDESNASVGDEVVGATTSPYTPSFLPLGSAACRSTPSSNVTIRFPSPPDEWKERAAEKNECEIRGGRGGGKRWEGEEEEGERGGRGRKRRGKEVGGGGEGGGRGGGKRWEGEEEEGERGGRGRRGRKRRGKEVGGGGGVGGEGREGGEREG